MEQEHEHALLRTGVSPSMESSDNQPHEHTDLLRSSQPALGFGDRSWLKRNLGKLLIIVNVTAILIMFVALILIAIVTWKLFVLDTSTLAINIHVKLSAHCEELAIDYNDKIHKLDPSEAINLTTLQMPHITLYLTNFMYLRYSDIDQVMEKLVPQFPSSCNVTLTNFTIVSGAYVMWDVAPSSCLQHMSDAIVNGTYTFIQQHQPVPDWVRNITDPAIREKKTHYVDVYGSPNVLDQFSPHVTLAADSRSPSALADAASQLSISSCTFMAEKIALGSVGDFGTVLRDEDMDMYIIGGSSS